MAVQDAREDALLARARAGATPSAAAQKKVADALERLDRAQIADGVSGPAWERTPRETLGELLLATGKAKEALAQFERNLEARPNRALALLGAARAAKVAGEAARARAYYATLADLWSNADAALPGLAEVRAGAT
jgi:Tfp pilus assembly protein PilF